MHFREAEATIFGKRVERGIFPNQLGCKGKAHQFERSTLGNATGYCKTNSLRFETSKLFVLFR